MTEPQVWVLIGVFAAAMFGVLGLIVPLINRATRAAIGELRGEMLGGFGELRGEMAGGIGELRGEMLGGFKAVEVKLEHLDRDVSALMKREFGIPDE